jgi:hypothetical protein
VGLHGPHCSTYSTYKKNKYKKNENKKYKNPDFSDNPGDPDIPDVRIPYCERWEDMVDDVSRLFEWAVANRLNKIEWLLLGPYIYINTFVFTCMFIYRY